MVKKDLLMMDDGKEKKPAVKVRPIMGLKIIFILKVQRSGLKYRENTVQMGRS